MADSGCYIWIADFPSVDLVIKSIKTQLLYMHETAQGKENAVSLFKDGMMEWIRILDWRIVNDASLNGKN